MISDPAASVCDLGEVRFTSQHVSANTDAQKDAVTAFMVTRSVGANAVTRAAWNYMQVAGTSASDDYRYEKPSTPKRRGYPAVQRRHRP